MTISFDGSIYKRTGYESEIAKKRLIAMCNPRYLGNLNIAEFDNVYDWWNFLGEIALKAKNGETTADYFR